MSWGAHHTEYLTLEARMGHQELRAWNVLVAMSREFASRPSLETIAGVTQMCRRDAQRALVGLERLGAISRDFQRGRATRYRIVTAEEAKALVSQETLESALHLVRAVKHRRRPNDDGHGAPPVAPAVTFPPAGGPPDSVPVEEQPLEFVEYAEDEGPRVDQAPPAPAPVRPPPPAPAAPAPRATPIGAVMRDELARARAAQAPAPAAAEPPPAPVETSRRPPVVPQVGGAMGAKLERLARGQGLDVGWKDQEEPPAAPAPAAAAPSPPPRPLPPGKRPETDAEIEAALVAEGLQPAAVKAGMEALRRTRARGTVTHAYGLAAKVAREAAVQAPAPDAKNPDAVKVDALIEADTEAWQTPCAAHGKPPPCGECAASVLASLKASWRTPAATPAEPAPTAPALQKQPPCPVCGHRAVSPGPCLKCELARIQRNP